MKRKYISFAILILGVFVSCFGLLSDVLRGRPFLLGHSQILMVASGGLIFFFGIMIWTGTINKLIKLLIPIANYIAKIIRPSLNLIRQSRLNQEIILFSGFLLILGAINAPILSRQTELTFNKEILPVFCAGLLLLFAGFYFKKRTLVEPSEQKPTGKHKSLEYSPEIDGLRALAVVPVMLYHLKIKGFEGGYVGVDVFFVISGFLITGIIYREVQTNSFSIANFYERRIRRIFPALFVMLLFAGIVGLFLLDPTTLKGLGEAIFSTTFFTSNFLLWNQAGYFDKAADLKPLLHTWSLAVEEQFYVFFPLLFVLIWHLFKKHIKLVLGLIAIASFILSQVWLKIDTSAAFYLLPYRAWELLLGGLLAVEVLPALKSKWLRNAAGMLGLGMILASVFCFSSETPFPGAAALLPTIGALLVIYSSSNHDTLTGRILSWEPFVFTGKISYSLYLWHWVLIVYARYYNILPLNEWQNALIFAASFAISSVVWKFVENPFRNKKVVGRKAIFSFGLAITLVMGITGYLFSDFLGFPGRFAPLPEYSESNFGSNIDLQNCLEAQDHIKLSSVDSKDDQIRFARSLCSIGDKTEAPTMAIFGDSHTRAVAYGLNELLTGQGIHATVIYTSGCPPTLGIVKDGNQACKTHNDMAFTYLVDHPEIKTVVLIGRWAIDANGTRYKQEGGENVILEYADNTNPPSEDNITILEYGLDQAITKLEESGKQVVFVNDVPEVGYNVPESYFVAKLTGRDINQLIAPTVAEFNVRYQPVLDILALLQKEHPNLLVVNLAGALCDENRCIVVKDGVPLYVDGDHLNVYGSVLVESKLKEILNGLEN